MSTTMVEPVKTVHEIRLTELDPPEAPGRKLMEANLDLIRDVKVRLLVSVGRCELSVKELFELKESSVLTLDSGTRETVDVLLDGKVVARGNLVAVGDSFGVQITEVVKR
jgi:flagellar motor switch protein FliN/FliY